jgi:hypothetical protein
MQGRRLRREVSGLKEIEHCNEVMKPARFYARFPSPSPDALRRRLSENSLPPNVSLNHAVKIAILWDKSLKAELKFQ